MTIKTTGISKDTPDRIFVDAGAVYLDYGLSTQRLLGATRGGNEFNLNREIRDIEVDGARGSVKGLRRRTVCRPQITCNLIELSLDNLLKAIAGANRADGGEIAVEAEYLGTGNSAVLFPLAHEDVVANTEKVFLDAVLQSRSAKYDSNFVGDDAAENKEFETGTGNWAAGHLSDTIESVSGGKSGNCLKYSAGSGALVGFLTLPGGSGEQLKNLVSGQHYKLRVALKRADFTPTITIACGAGAKAGISPTTSWVVHVIEFEATSADPEITLVASGAPTENDVLYVDFLELEEVDGDYVMNWDKGEVIFTDAPTSPEEITISYTYTNGNENATHDVITGGDIGDEDYIDNVALVGTVSGKTSKVICIVKNALADAGFSLATAPRDEAVPAIVFTGHYDPADPDSEPWEIRYPRS